MTRKGSARPAIALAAALGLVGAACGDDEADPVYLGPVDAGAVGIVDAAAEAEAAAPVQAEPLDTLACTTAALTGSSAATLVRDLSTLEGRALIASDDSVLARQLDADGCPGEPIASFGTNGTLAMQAFAVAPLAGGRSLVATADDLKLLDSTGAVAGSCTQDGANVRARLVDALPEGRAVAAFTRSPVTVMETMLASPAQCSATSQALDPAPFAIAALALDTSGKGLVTVQQDTADSPLQVARYDANGKRTAVLGGSSDPARPAHLCSAQAVLDTPAGVVVADARCKRVLRFGADSQRVHVASFDGSPQALAWVQPKVLIAVVEPLQDGAVATFQTLQ